MEEKMQTLDEKLTQVDAKLSLLLSVPKTDEKDKHETIKLQIELEKMRMQLQLEQKKMDHERQMRDDTWERENALKKKEKIELENKPEEPEEGPNIIIHTIAAVFGLFLFATFQKKLRKLR